MVIASVIIWGYSVNSSPKSSVARQNNKEITTALSPEVEALIAKKLRAVESLMKKQIIVQAVSKANEKNKLLTKADILKLDSDWQNTKEENDFIKQFLENDAAKELILFQEENPGFKEVFVSDKTGLNVAQTNKTSDFYQADEEWWMKGFDNGKGRAFHGPIEFDESAQSEAIALYVPIFDTQTKKAIGVAKAVLDINSIKAEL